MQAAEKDSPRGSLKWIRLAVNEHTAPFNSAVAEACGLGDGSRIEWVSPLAKNGYKEHCDQACLDRLSITLPNRPLSDFWPKGGPHWDALARTSTGTILLVEAKANVPEIVSNGTGAADPASKQLIERSLAETKAFLRVDPSIPWSGKLYQYANRLAHLYLLRELNGIPAFLVFVYFIGDEDVEGPKTVEEWKAALTVAKRVLGINGRNPMSKYVRDVFVEVATLR